MANDTAQEAAAGEEPYTWVRCSSCGNGLWRQFAERLEMQISPRGGQRRRIVVPLEVAHDLRVGCEKCGNVWAGTG